MWKTRFAPLVTFKTLMKDDRNKDNKANFSGGVLGIQPGAHLLFGRHLRDTFPITSAYCIFMNNSAYLNFSPKYFPCTRNCLARLLLGLAFSERAHFLAVVSALLSPPARVLVPAFCRWQALIAGVSAAGSSSCVYWILSQPGRQFNYRHKYISYFAKFS